MRYISITFADMPEKQSAPQQPGTACREKRGTDAGYKRHHRRSEPACADCLTGHNEATKARYRAAGGENRLPTVEMDRELFTYLWFHTPEVVREAVKHGIRPKSFLQEFGKQ